MYKFIGSVRRIAMGYQQPMTGSTQKSSQNAGVKLTHAVKGRKANRKRPSDCNPKTFACGQCGADCMWGDSCCVFKRDPNTPDLAHSPGAKHIGC